MKFEYKTNKVAKIFVIEADNVFEACEKIKDKHDLREKEFPYGIEFIRPIHQTSINLTFSELTLLMSKLSLFKDDEETLYYRLEEAALNFKN